MVIKFLPGCHIHNLGKCGCIFFNDVEQLKKAVLVLCRAVTMDI